jgi:hypothetical protein
LVSAGRDYERPSGPHLACPLSRAGECRSRTRGGRHWFTTTFALAFGDSRYALKVEKGCIVDIVAEPKFDVRALFRFRAPVEVWRKFLKPNPPPLLHDFFATTGPDISARYP